MKLELPGGLAAKNPMLSLLCQGFDPWPGNVCVLWVLPPKKVMTVLSLVLFII